LSSSVFNTIFVFFFFSSRRRHTRSKRDWSSDVCSSDLTSSVSVDYDKATDTLDVWFDSGTTHFAVLEQRDELTNPADMYLEGSRSEERRVGKECRYRWGRED